MFYYGCRYCKMDMMRQVEYCALTDELTNAKPECDFLYEHCPKYQNALKAKASKRKAKSKSEPQFTQTSIFGKIGEKPFRV